MLNVIGGAVTWIELSEVLLKIGTHVQFNWRPLSYVGDAVELLTLTQLPEQEMSRTEETSLTKRSENLQNGWWSSWQREYFPTLRERHNLTHKASKHQPKGADIVILKYDNRNCGAWPLAIVIMTHSGGDGIIREVELKMANGITKQPDQFLYQLDLEYNS